MSAGDVRKALSALEVAALTTSPATSPDENDIIKITFQVADESIQKKVIVYDKKRRSALRHNIGLYKEHEWIRP